MLLRRRRQSEQKRSLPRGSNADFLSRVKRQYSAPTAPVIAPNPVAGSTGEWPTVKGPDGHMYYQAPTPLNDLGHIPALVDCPHCGKRGHTATSLSAGNMNHAFACCAFFPFVIFTFIPYMISGLKNVEHWCQSCGKRLAVWHRTGHTQVK